MIRVTCDGCEKPIDRDSERWFGLDLSEPPRVLNVGTLGNPATSVELLTELRVSGDHEYHFCSATCLSAWAFSKELA